jgi:hypothetical protein
MAEAEEKGSAGLAGLSRRQLIQRAAATGMTAWIAPTILDSLTSPAAAVSGAAGALSRFQVDSQCSVQSQTSNPSCAPTNWSGASNLSGSAGNGHFGGNGPQPFNATPTCMSATGLPSACSVGSLTINMGSDAGCTCTFVSGSAVDDLGRCITAVVSNSGKTITIGPAAVGGTIQTYYVVVSC